MAEQPSPASSCEVFGDDVSWESSNWACKHSLKVLDKADYSRLINFVTAGKCLCMSPHYAMKIVKALYTLGYIK